MKKIELLAPAGSFDVLKSAIHSGCDAVYLGGRKFGARAFADNFDHDEMKEAIAYAHRYGVKVYVTMNTLIYDEELDECLRYVETLYHQDVDALIIQDLGLFDMIHQSFPDLELHASTQMHIHNRDGVKFLKEKGINRVVLARETPLEEIEKIACEGVELEVFVHGALCVSYSGQCLMSAKLFDRSGNRGACAQPCRMRYTLMKKQSKGWMEVKDSEGYLLSLKDLYTLQHIDKLIDAGVTSFKIEGRMKSAEYVAQVVSTYREAIDAHLNHQKYQVKEEVEVKLKKVYNRGFTSGHLMHDRGMALANPIRPNHIGVSIGKVIACDHKFIKVKLSDHLQQGDGIRFIQKKKEDEGFIAQRIYNEKGLLIKQASAKDIILFDRKNFIEVGAELIKSSDILLFNELRNVFEKEPRKVSLRAVVTFKIDQPLSFHIFDDEHHEVLCISDQMVEKALKTPMDKNRIIQQFSKSGNTPYKIDHIDLDMDDGATISIKVMNELRRTALDQMDEKRAVRHNKNERIELTKYLFNTQKLPSYIVSVATQDQYDVAKELGCDVIFEENESSRYVSEKRVCLGSSMRNHHHMITQIGNLIDIGEETYASDTLNASNFRTCAFLQSLGIKGILLSSEMRDTQIERLMSEFKQCYGFNASMIKTIYGSQPLMISEHCPIALKQGCQKKHCGLCVNQDFALKDMKGRVFPITTDDECRIHLWDTQPENDMDKIRKYQDMGISCFHLVFQFEDKETTRLILDQFLLNINI